LGYLRRVVPAMGALEGSRKTDISSSTRKRLTSVREAPTVCHLRMKAWTAAACVKTWRFSIGAWG
jgi:hypothetical protein